MPAAEGSNWGMGGAKTDGERTKTGLILRKIMAIREKRGFQQQAMLIKMVSFRLFLTMASFETILIVMKEDYPSYLTRESKPFDPIKLAHQTEEIVGKGSSRKYTGFYCTGVYGGISTGYAVGCCLRCVFCWVDWSRDFPYQIGQFYSPEQSFNNLLRNAQKAGAQKIRISGAEPTLYSEHLLSVLSLIDETPFLFILETNGILFGHDPGYVDRLKKHRNIHVRVSLKAGNPEGFEKRTGARGEFYELPFKAVEHLRKAGINFHVAAMTDPRLMQKEEREMLLHKLSSVGYHDYLEEEICDPYSTSVKRLEKADFKIWK